MGGGTGLVELVIGEGVPIADLFHTFSSGIYSVSGTCTMMRWERGGLMRDGGSGYCRGSNKSCYAKICRCLPGVGVSALGPDEEVETVTHQTSHWVPWRGRSDFGFLTGLYVSKTQLYSRYSEADRNQELKATLDRLSPSVPPTTTHPD